MKRLPALLLVVIVFLPVFVLLTLSSPSSTATALQPNLEYPATQASHLIVTTTADKLLFESYRSGNDQLYTINLDGSNLVTIANSTDADDPRWSPDGQEIVFVRFVAYVPQIFVMNADGTNSVNISNNTASETDPCWSPDGKKIAFVSNRQAPYGSAQLFVMNSDGTNAQQLTNFTGFDGISTPDWSANGNKITFAFTPDYSNQSQYPPQIYTIDSTGSSLTQLTSGSGALRPRWSPDGTHIAFSSRPSCGNTSCTNDQLYIMNADGSNSHTITSSNSGHWGPVWSPDGTQIAFSEYIDPSGWRISIINSDGTGQIGGPIPPSPYPSVRDAVADWHAFNNFATIPMPKDYKQDGSPWSGQHLNPQNTACSSYNIGGYGCAVTSVADVLAYYGAYINGSFVDPGLLNNWLSSRPGGFSGCWINWGLAGLLTNSKVDTYASGNNINSINNALAANPPEPAIVSVPGLPAHYVVVIGNAGTANTPDYIILDPLSWRNDSYKPLSQTVYGTVPSLISRGFLQTIIIHKPGTRTSTFNAFGHSPIQLLITDPSGFQTGYNPSTGSVVQNIPSSAYFVQGSIGDELGSGPTLTGTLYFQQNQPSNGSYNIQVTGTGSGSYQLDLTSLTSSGDTSTQTVTGTTTLGSTSAYTVPISGTIYPLFLPAIVKNKTP